MTHNKTELNPPISLVIAPDADPITAERLRQRFGPEVLEDAALSDPFLRLDSEGLALVSEGQVLRGDFTRLLPRLKQNLLNQELLVRTAKIKNPEGPLTAVDATAGLGEDSLLLAAAGFHVRMYEHNPIIYELLLDALRRAAAVAELAEIVGRMQVFNEDSVAAMGHLDAPPDVILLDPMFPARQKSALVKKKLQMIQKLEIPCAGEAELLLAAMKARPKKLIIKRPPKGPYLAEVKPDHSITGKAVRFDCIVNPYEKIHKYNL